MQQDNVAISRLVSVVIPCYGSEKTIRPVVEEVISCLSPLCRYEVVLVCDGSPDNVWREIVALGNEHSEVKGILFAKNFGQHAATMAGYRHAQGDVIVTMDDDGQCPAAGIAPMISKLDEGYDVVYARYDEAKKSRFRMFGSWLNGKMAEWLAGKPRGVVANSFYAMRRFVMEEMVRYDLSYPYLGGLVFRATDSIANVDVEHRGRAEGTSGYSLLKLLQLWMNGFTAFSVKPLRIASFLGVVFSVVGFAFTVVLIVRKLMNPDVPLGYTSTMASLLFIGGLLLMALGLVGEYVGRMYIGLNKSPQYVIKETTDE